MVHGVPVHPGAEVTDDTPQPFQAPVSATTDRSVLAFVFNQLLRGKAFACMVRVDACTNSGGITPSGTVDATILANQVGGGGSNPTPHISIYGLPYMRLQGGDCAIIIDPKPGDVGIAVFAMRDETLVRAAAVANQTTPGSVPAQASPGSDRTCDYADGMYLGGLLNGVPVNYMAITDAQTTIFHTTKIVISAPSVEIDASTAVTVTSPNVNASGNITADGTIYGKTDVTFGPDATSGNTHEHPTAAPGAPSPPTPGS